MSLLGSALWSLIPGGVTAPEGFKASARRAGFKESNDLDLALLLAPDGAVCCGTFTESFVRASCIDLSQKRLRETGGRVRAVMINSGQANACTGDAGSEANLLATQVVAEKLGLKPQEVLINSTGVIGVPIPMHKLLKAIDPLIEALNENGGSNAAKAILTTDLVQKECALKADLGGQIVRIGGMAKGSGMIHPNMATMLAYLTCDAAIPENIWRPMVKRAVEKSFNSISVDGDTSTNDTFLAFNAGKDLDKKYWNSLENGLLELTKYLAKAIARDGEGANILLEVNVVGTNSDHDALLIARTIVSSSLVKAALNGCDPNWGRIIAAAGRAGVSFRSEEVCLWFGPYQLLSNGQPIQYDCETVKEYMKLCMKGDYLESDCVLIRLSIGKGSGSARAWGCDLSEKYVRINADYTT